MQNNYTQLSQQLQETRRQAGVYRQKSNNYLTQMSTLQDDNQLLRSKLKEQHNHLEKIIDQNKHLKEQNEQMVMQYGNSINQVKQQIHRKQQQLQLYQENQCTSQINNKMIRKQLTNEIENEYEIKIENIENKLKQMESNKQKLQQQLILQKQKSQYQINLLQKQLKQIKNQHQIQIQQYNNKLYNFVEKKNDNSNLTELKKYKKQISSLKNQLDLKQQLMNQAFDQRCKLQQQYVTELNTNKNNFQKIQQQLSRYRKQCERLSLQLKNNPEKDDNNRLNKQRQYQLKKLRNQVERLYDIIKDNQNKNSQLSLEKQQLINQIKSIKVEYQGNRQQQEQKLRSEKQILQKQIKKLKTQLITMHNSNQELITNMVDQNKSISRSNLKSRQQESCFKGTKVYGGNMEDFSLQEEMDNQRVDEIKTNQKRIDEKQINARKSQSSQFRKQYESLQDSNNLGNKLKQSKQRYEQLENQYTELLKQNSKLQKKFKIANNKVIQLLHGKLQTLNPSNVNQPQMQRQSKLTRQFFQERVNKEKYRMIQNREKNISKENFMGREQRLSKIQPLIHYNDKQHEQEQNQHVQKQHSEYQPNLQQYQQFPQQFSQQRLQKQQIFRSPQHIPTQQRTSSVNKSYYEKSLSIRKAQKMKQLQCMNHEGQTNN